MKNAKTLNIKGALLNKEQLKSYLEKMASDDVLIDKADKSTYPIPVLIQNFEYITKTYDLLNLHLKLGISIHQAGEWLLDNYYIIEETVKEVRKNLPLKKYVKFPGIASGKYKGFARSYVLACEIVGYTEGVFGSRDIEEYLQSYQSKKTLNMEEIWNISLFFKIALVERIREICEKIYSSQIQKLKVESIIERLVESKNKKELKFTPFYKSIEPYKENSYAFIEYMSYKLKKYGKNGIAYLNILEEEINKQGLTLAEVIKKEHFDIALKKVLIGNSIKSIHLLQRMNFVEVFEKINGTEEVLRQDPSGTYENMDYKTKEYYRNKIKEIAEKSKISEIYISKKIVELASVANEAKKKHIGYYLIDDGIYDLYQSLGINKINPEVKKKTKLNLYVYGMIGISIVFSYIMGVMLYKGTKSFWLGFILAVLIFIPVTEIVTKIMQNILNKTIKPKLIPKMDFSKGIPKDCTTLIVIPSILKDTNDVKRLLKKLEVYYLANESKNIYCLVLGDCTPSKKEKDGKEEEIINNGLRIVDELNKKYGKGIFNFIYRKRVWNDGEGMYIGWERKRGILTELNEFIACGNDKNTFLVNTLKDIQDVKFKYVITLDSDTELTLNSGIELIQAMAHPLNKPVVDGGKVVKGYAIIQPRIGINLGKIKKSMFTEIFAGSGGVDSYTNAISDVYQDNFGEGTYTGKGIYDVDVFCSVLHNKIPENTVLSHDLLEGCLLRCGLASDIMLLDDYPKSYMAYITRFSRWIRGDWQVFEKLKLWKTDLNKLSKFKILDNIRRSLIEIAVILCIIFLTIIRLNYNVGVGTYVTIALASVAISSIIEAVNYVIFRKENIKRQRKFTNMINEQMGSLYRAIISIITLPTTAYISASAIIKTIYRTKISKKHLLEWTTADEAERKDTNKLVQNLKVMFPNIVIGVFCLIFGWFVNPRIFDIFLYVLGVLFIVAPVIMWTISKEYSCVSTVHMISQDELSYVKEIAKRTWGYFNDFMKEKVNFLPPDNLQESRRERIAYRTSSTNIGLGLLTIVSAYDLKFIDLEKAVAKLENVMDTVCKLEKWNGHLYNWYDLKTLQPLKPRYVSSVDSGNFVGYLYVLKAFLEEKQHTQYKDRIEELLRQVTEIIDKTDFSYLYSEENRLLSIGYNVDENKLTDTYYDLLASEARQASLVAIAKKQIPSKHWNNLSRTLTKLGKYKGLISWSGTAFEYLMPNINIKRYEGSLLDESCKFMIMSQIKYCAKLGIPWGISEAGFNLKDLNSNYQYKAFGVPWLGLKRGLEDEMVVSSYASILAICDYPKEVIRNLKELEKQGMFGEYGFFESIDYTPSRLPAGKSMAVVETYMAHHQALILLSINNLINDNILQKRFMENPEIRGVDILLQERMPQDMLITKEKKEKTKKIKYVGLDNYVENRYKIKEFPRRWNCLSSENYIVQINDRGEGFSTYNGILVNKYKETSNEKNGIFFYIRNRKTKEVWKATFENEGDKCEAIFAGDTTKLIKEKFGIETEMKVIASPRLGTEIRRLCVHNHLEEDVELDVISIFEPVLSRMADDWAHPIFNNLFLKYDISATGDIIVKRNGKNPMCMGVNLFLEEEENSKTAFEIDLSKVNDILYGNADFESKVKYVTEGCIAISKNITVKAGDEKKLNLVISVSKDEEEILQNLEYYKIAENVKNAFNITRANLEEETRYLNLSKENIQAYNMILPYILEQNPMKSLYMNKLTYREYKQSDLWKYGISGDLPIILVQTNSVNDVYVVKELLKVHENLRAKGILADLVILDYEKNVYERYVRDQIIQEIWSLQIGYLQNVSSGIFLLNAGEIEDEDLLKFRANILINASKGSLVEAIKEQEEEYISYLARERNELK